MGRLGDSERGDGNGRHRGVDLAGQAAMPYIFGHDAKRRVSVQMVATQQHVAMCLAAAAASRYNNAVT
jgi:hypothetical protein